MPLYPSSFSFFWNKSNRNVNYNTYQNTDGQIEDDLIAASKLAEKRGKEPIPN
jgi:hypothetical protein